MKPKEGSWTRFKTQSLGVVGVGMSVGESLICELIPVNSDK